MEMSISANHASSAAVSQLIKPQTNAVAQQSDSDHDNDHDQGPESVTAAASELQSSNAQGALGRLINKLA